MSLSPSVGPGRFVDEIIHYNRRECVILSVYPLGVCWASDIRELESGEVHIRVLHKQMVNPYSLGH